MLFQRKIFIIFWTILFCSLLNNINAQNNTNNRLQITDIQGALHFVVENYSSTRFNDFNKNFDKFKNHAKDINDFSNFDIDTFERAMVAPQDERSYVIGVYTTILLLNKEKNDNVKRHTFRIGIDYYRNRNTDVGFINYLYNSEDSVFRQRLNYRESIDELAFEAGYVFRTNPDKRLMFYTGIGIGTGFSVTSRIQETFLEDYDKYKYINDNWELVEFDKRVSYKENTFKAKRTFNARVFIPIGFNARIYNNYNLFSEVRIGRFYQQFLPSPAGYRKHLGIGFGIKYCL